VPFPTARHGETGASAARPLPLAHASDQLRRVVPDGREDLALASAFEIGRLLALSQLSVVSALLRFRAEQFGAHRIKSQLEAVLPFALPDLVSNAGPKRIDLARFVAVQVVDILAQNAERMLGPRRPVADPGRPLKVEGEIDRLIATGLGLDYEALVKRGSQLGMLAALQDTSAPLATALGEGKFGAAEQAALADALTLELNRSLSVAMPPVVLKAPAPQRKRRGAAAAPQPAPGDALDLLMSRAAELDEEDAPAEQGPTGRKAPR
jgi:hypothetical protein